MSGPVDGAAAPVGRTAHRLHLQPSPLPVADRVDEAELRRVVFLTQQMDLVAEADKRLDQLRVVDVRARPAQEIPVEDQQPHECEDRKEFGRLRLLRYRPCYLGRSYGTSRAIPPACARIRPRGRDLDRRHTAAGDDVGYYDQRHRRAHVRGREARAGLGQSVDSAPRPGEPSHLPALRAARGTGPQRLPALPTPAARARRLPEAQLDHPVRRFGLIAIAAIVTGLARRASLSPAAATRLRDAERPGAEAPARHDHGRQRNDGPEDDLDRHHQSRSAPAQTQTTPSAPSGGAQSPQQDTPQNDVAPPQGSPGGSLRAVLQGQSGRLLSARPIRASSSARVGHDPRPVEQARSPVRALGRAVPCSPERCGLVPLVVGGESLRVLARGRVAAGCAPRLASQ